MNSLTIPNATAIALSVVGVTLAAPEGNRSNLVILDEASVKNLRLELVEAEERDFEDTIFALGRIRVASGHRAVVSSRVPGRALAVAAHIDTKMEKGAEAVVLESRQSGDPPPAIRLTAPISGLVSAVNIAVGQPVEPDDSLIEILDLTEVHAVAAVPEHLAGKVQVGQAARIHASGFPDREFVAEVVHLGAQADEETGTVEVAFHVENTEMILRPGMRAEFSIAVSKREGVMAVPREAIQGDLTRRFVYVADYELKNAFLKTPVETGAQNDRFVEIVSGVLPGDEVVTRGAYALAFAGKGSISLKEALDAAHGHPHDEQGRDLPQDGASTAAGSGGGAGHTHPAATPLVLFLAGSNLLLLILLVLSLVVRKRAAASR